MKKKKKVGGPMLSRRKEGGALRIARKEKAKSISWTESYRICGGSFSAEGGGEGGLSLEDTHTYRHLSRRGSLQKLVFCGDTPSLERGGERMG